MPELPILIPHGKVTNSSPLAACQVGKNNKPHLLYDKVNKIYDLDTGLHGVTEEVASRNPVSRLGVTVLNDEIHVFYKDEHPPTYISTKVCKNGIWGPRSTVVKGATN